MGPGATPRKPAKLASQAPATRRTAAILRNEAIPTRVPTTLAVALLAAPPRADTALTRRVIAGLVLARAA